MMAPDDNAVEAIRGGEVGGPYCLQHETFIALLRTSIEC